MGSVKILLGDSLDVLKTFEAASIDALVTDPPAGIEFMGKAWDTFREAEPFENGRTVTPEWGAAPGTPFARRQTPWPTGRDKSKILEVRAAFVDYVRIRFVEALRVLKPGAWGLVWALPRTSGWTQWALEDAGFEVRDRVSHLFGQGFPKGPDAGRQIDMKRCALPGKHCDKNLPRAAKRKPEDHLCPPHVDGDVWRDWKTALKPGCEDWWLVRKPLEGNLGQNVLEHGTGAMNIGGCRLATAESLNGGAYTEEGGRSDLPGADRSDSAAGMLAPGKTTGREFQQPLGRYPSHVVLSHADACELIGMRKVKTGTAIGGKGNATSIYGTELDKHDAEDQSYGKDGLEEVEDWNCVEDCPVQMLDEQSGILKSGTAGDWTGEIRDSPALGKKRAMIRVETIVGDSGGASRFFYCGKASKKDRGVDNDHPTVKANKLMRWLCRLITPPGGLILDMFGGSGSTGVAAVEEGFSVVLIEKDASSIAIAQRRLGLDPAPVANDVLSADDDIWAEG